MTAPVRILQVLATLDQGGLESVVINWTRQLDPNKVAFDFVLNSGGPYAFEQDAFACGSRIFRAPVMKGWNLPYYAYWWLSFLGKHPEWRIVHAHHTTPAAVFLSISRLLGRLTLAHSHTSGMGQSIRDYLRKMGTSPLRHIAHIRLACSRDAASWMFGNDRNARVIPNGIDVETFRFDEIARRRARAGLKLDDKIVLGHVGRLTAVKNHSWMLEILGEITARGVDAHLLLVGDGKLRRELSTMADNMSLSSRVSFLGSSSDVASWLSAMDVFMFPSIFEGLGVSLVEAQAAGVPCVISPSIPAEAVVTDLVVRVSLEESASTWADTVLKVARAHQTDLTGKARRHWADVVIEAGYDASTSAAALTNIYLDRLRGS